MEDDLGIRIRPIEQEVSNTKNLEQQQPQSNWKARIRSASFRVQESQ